MRLYGTPRETAEALERTRPLPAGGGERFTGYGVMALPFAGGDLLAFCRFVASSIGPAYSAVWHRDARGCWTFYVDVAAGRSCLRYFGEQVGRVVVTEIRVGWSAAAELGVSVPRARVDLSLRLGASPGTHLVNSVLRVLPSAIWHAPPALAVLCGVAGPTLGADVVRLTGMTPNGHVFRLVPRQIWHIVAGIAAVRGRELGPIGELSRQAQSHDYVLPNAGMFAFGAGFFEICDPVGPHRGLGSEA